jgi:predicted Rossmann fold nucleotide-binding protein DprA/Smf involved in DNA uptake
MSTLKVRHVGFTGTREGMSDYQKAVLKRSMAAAHCDGIENILHHGDCKGADAEAHAIAVELGWDIIIHPPTRRIMRAYCGDGAIILLPMDYLERDQAIVNASRFMFAAPKSDKEERRSGTWYTVRYARKMGKRVILLNRNEDIETSQPSP